MSIFNWIAFVVWSGQAKLGQAMSSQISTHIKYSLTMGWVYVQQNMLLLNVSTNVIFLLFSIHNRFLSHSNTRFPCPSLSTLSSFAHYFTYQTNTIRTHTIHNELSTDKLAIKNKQINGMHTKRST